MKKNLNTWLATAAVAAIIFAGCSKQENTVSPAPTSSELSVPEIEVLGQLADEEFANFEITGGTETENFAIESDGIPDAYQITEATADQINSSKRDGEAKRIRYCLSKLELDRDQIAKLKHLFREYDACKSSIVKRYTYAIRKMTAEYNDRYEALVKAVRNGRITKAEFEKHVKVLRIEFSRSKKHLAQKSRAALKACYIKMLRGMHGVLSERQWKAFVNCYR